MKPFLLASCLVALFVGAAPADPSGPLRTGYAASADGVPIYAAMRGEDDPALVFIHGWSMDGKYWKAQLEHFAPRHRAVAVDLAGHGASYLNREEWTMEAYGRDILAVIEEFGLRKVILIGHSMGGIAMVEAALQDPDRVVGLIGVDSFHDPHYVLSDEQLAGFMDPFRKDFRRATYRWVRSMFPAGADSILAHEVAVDMALAPSTLAKESLTGALEWYGGLAAGRIGALTVPLVDVNAAEPVTEAEAMKALVPAHRLWVLPGVGHFPMVEDPEGLNEALAEAIAYLMALDD